jgi:hypothetical protein
MQIPNRTLMTLISLMLLFIAIISLIALGLISNILALITLSAQFKPYNVFHAAYLTWEVNPVLTDNHLDR